jgi:tRNA pseudouridine38-40 synthase
VATQRWRLHLAYDGALFHGFADQPGQRTIAGELADALARTSRAGARPQITGAGRTDAGVHARGQVVHVDLPSPLPAVRRPAGERPMDAPDLVAALNRQLGPAIVVRAATPVGDDFDARRSATARRYRYLVWDAPVADPLYAPIAWHVAGPLDLRAMVAAADTLLGEHDFRAFCRRAPGTTADDPIPRRVTEARWTEVRDPDSADAGPGRLLRFEIEAQSFCHQMVRSLVGALVGVGRGQSNAAGLVVLLRSASRQGAPDPAPAHGLCLVGVSYGAGAPGTGE